MNIWNKEDPRILINKYGKIIIVDRRGVKFAVGVGSVDTKNGWSILTNIERYEHISADDNWPEGFVWAFAPDPCIA